jgi:hypothetical protein
VAYDEFHDENPTNGSDNDTWSQTSRQMRRANVVSTQGIPFYFLRNAQRVTL